MNLRLLKKILVVKTLLFLAFLSVSSDYYLKVNLIEIGDDSGIIEDISSVEILKIDDFENKRYRVVEPIDKVLNWREAPKEFWTADFGTIPNKYFIDLPEYDSELLSKSWQSLDLSSEQGVEVYNLKKTYPAVFMGNYKIDGKEYVGSHTGIDIRTPLRTPVRAFAEGKVVKAVEQSFGFGNHVVIEHSMLPKLDNSREFVTYYSTYGHLDEVNVEVGEVVSVGEVIGLTGSTGASSTEHLHFQIDKQNSPAVPYWPLNSLLLSELNMSFVEAVNAGVGMDEALKYVINPFDYIEKYGENDLVFTDVSYGDEGAEAIAYLKDRGVFNGYGDGSFRPDSFISRAEVLKVITELKEDEISKLDGGEVVVFLDVQPDYWFADLVAYAFSEGIVSGYPDQTFRPEQEILGVEFLKMMLEAMDNENDYLEFDGENWYLPYIEDANRRGLLLEGVNYFEPITRRQVAELIYRQFVLAEQQ